MSLSSFRPSLYLPILRVPEAVMDRAMPAARRVAESRPASAAPAALRVEVLSASAAALHRDAWVDLQARGLDSNVFLDPDFALPAAQHLGPAGRPTFVMVWDDAVASRRLVGLCAVSGSLAPRRRLVRPWAHDLMTLGSPLLDGERGGDALTAILDAVGGCGDGGAGMLFGAVPAAGATAALIDAVARTTGRRVVRVAAWERAVLRRGHDAGRSGHAALSSKGAKEARRRRRRLAERGDLGFASARSDRDVRDAAERFLALEARGWKGAAGTALLMQPGRTAFARAMTRLLGRRGRCRIDALTLDGIPIAMGIVLTDGTTDYLWKIAYDQDLARFSPGVQFVLDLTERQHREGRAVSTDSCAIAGHPMIDRLWRDRLELADIVVGTGPGFDRAVAGVAAYRRLRAFAKRTVAALKDHGIGRIDSLPRRP